MNHPSSMSHETWRKMGSARQFARQQKCGHAHVVMASGMPRCTDCASYGPWPGHASHGHFPNGDPA